jgi:hypothetical protein
VIPEAVDLSVNARVLGFSLVAGVASGLLFGLAPVFHARRPNTNEALRNRGSVAGGARGAGMRGAFVILQIAVSLVLLVSAGLFLRTLKNAYSVDIGYEVDRIWWPLSIWRRTATSKAVPEGPLPDRMCMNGFFPVSRRFQALSLPAPRA